MSAVQEKTALAFDELLKAVEQLSPDNLEHLMKQVLALQAQHKAPCLPATEADLLLIINRCLPAEEQTRFDSLVAKRQANTLTAEEYQELIHMTDEIEKCDAQLGQRDLYVIIRQVVINDVRTRSVAFGWSNYY